MRTPPALYFLAAGMVTIGAVHFIAPGPFVDIVPDYLPAPLLLVYVSGVFELLGGIGLLVPRSRRFAAWGLVALFIAVFPANIHMAVHQITPAGTPPLPSWAPWARLPLQLALIAWAYRYTRPARGGLAADTSADAIPAGASRPAAGS